MTRIAQARAALRNKFGARQYRITREGVIHVRGTMPNTNTEAGTCSAPWVAARPCTASG